MHEGRIIYQGPRDDVLLYFKQLGYLTSYFCRKKLTLAISICMMGMCWEFLFYEGSVGEISENF